jgi:hypothetical protein
LLFDKQEKDYNLESTKYLKATGSKEQTETVKTNIEEDLAGETKVLVTEAPNEDSLKPIEEHEGVEKVNECENIIEQAEDRKSDFKESNTISAIDEILEEVSLNSIEILSYIYIYIYIYICLMLLLIHSQQTLI